MADSKIKDLTGKTPDNDDELVINDVTNGNVDKKIGIDDIDTFLSATTKTLTNKTINTASNTITIVEADISDLQSYITGITGEPLSDLSDVTITSIASGEIIKWNGSAWINNTLTEAGISATGHTHVEADITDLQSYLLNIVEDTTPQLGADLEMQGNNLQEGGVIFLKEQAAADADAPGEGQIWVQTATPNLLMFTDDAGTDFQLATLDGTETLTNKTINTASNTITVAEADISDLGTTVAMVADNLSVFAATTSAQLAGVISDETGSGALVFATSPTFTTSVILPDDVKVLFGTGSDASIYYNGTHMQFDSQEVGSGNFIFNNGDMVVTQTGTVSVSYTNKTSGAGTNILDWRGNGWNASSAEHEYARLGVFIRDDTDGAEDGELLLQAHIDGVRSTFFTCKGQNARLDIQQDAALTAAKKFYWDSGGDTYTEQTSADLVTHQVGGEAGLRLQETGTEINVVCGANNALATNATDGFLYIPTCAGTPTGTPTAYTGKTALVYDSTNNKIWVYDGSWIGVAVA